ncbi:MAG: hypothetical protein U0X20_30450 [Caldilineaceae bacterium]
MAALLPTTFTPHATSTGCSAPTSEMIATSTISTVMRRPERPEINRDTLKQLAVGILSVVGLVGKARAHNAHRNTSQIAQVERVYAVTLPLAKMETP